MDFINFIIQRLKIPLFRNFELDQGIFYCYAGILNVNMRLRKCYNETQIINKI